MNRGIYFLFLTIFILYIAFAALDGWKDVYVNWYLLNQKMSVSVQYYIWMLFMRLAMFLIFLAWFYESRPENKKMMRVLMFIHAWYFVEYVLHYNSIWITWKGTDSGLSSHILTMGLFAYYGRG